MSKQAASKRCDCGGEQRIVPMASPWEFEVTCDQCSGRWISSWFHGAPPPSFEIVQIGVAIQQELLFG